MVQRILILGCSGSGKSTLSRQLSRTLDLPVVHLDQLYWDADWQMKNASDFTQNVANAIEQKRWIMDGNYSSTVPARLADADLAIILDMPRSLCLRRVIQRTLLYYRRNRPDMPQGCNERFDWEFMRYIWSYNQSHRPKLMDLLDQYQGQKAILKSPQEVRAFVRSLENSL